MPKQPVSIVVDEEGVAELMVGEGAANPILQDFKEQGAEVSIRRASHVEPVNPLLRVAFHLLRRVFGERGRMAAYTRSWRCSWRVDLAPSGGPILGPFHDRRIAIRAELIWLRRNWVDEMAT